MAFLQALNKNVSLTVKTGNAPHQRGWPPVKRCPLLQTFPLSSLSSFLTSFPFLSVVPQQPHRGNQIICPSMKPWVPLHCTPQLRVTQSPWLSVSCDVVLGFTWFRMLYSYSQSSLCWVQWFSGNDAVLTIKQGAFVTVVFWYKRQQQTFFPSLTTSSVDVVCVARVSLFFFSLYW